MVELPYIVEAKARAEGCLLAGFFRVYGVVCWWSLWVAVGPLWRRIGWGLGLCGGGVGDIGCVLQVNLFEFDKGFDCLAFDDIWRDLGGW
jgi:hypothetical protein